MKSILEITPKTRTLYEMPDELYDSVRRVLSCRLAKNVAAAVNLMPSELRSFVKITVLPDEPVKNPDKESVMIYDYFEEITPLNHKLYDELNFRSARNFLKTITSFQEAKAAPLGYQILKAKRRRKSRVIRQDS